MAFPIRPNEEQNKILESFVSTSGHATKSKAILWLIENAQRLVDSDKTLTDIKNAHERRSAADNLISELLTR